VLSLSKASRGSHHLYFAWELATSDSTDEVTQGAESFACIAHFCQAEIARKLNYEKTRSQPSSVEGSLTGFGKFAPTIVGEHLLHREALKL